MYFYYERLLEKWIIPGKRRLKTGQQQQQQQKTYKHKENNNKTSDL